MRCVILSACPVSPELKRLLRPDDFIIACDAGYRNCAPLGCKPNIILGDFDTAPCPVQQNDDIIVLPHVKDDTDTEYAAKLASEKGFTEVLLLGALGGRRIEHTLSNLATGLGLEERGVRATLQDERSRVTFVRSGETRAYPKEEFFYFSAFPMEGRAEGVCERGSYYELTDDVLVAGYPLGVSNEYAEGSDCITISTRKGGAGGRGNGAGYTDPDREQGLSRTLCRPAAYIVVSHHERRESDAGGRYQKPEVSARRSAQAVRHQKRIEKYRGRQLLRYFLWHIILLWYRSDPAPGQRGQR